MSAARRRSHSGGTDRRLKRDAPVRALPAWLRRAVHLSLGLLLLSGLMWLIFHYALPVETEYGIRPHPWTYQWLRLHGAAALLALLAMGALLPVHIPEGWKRNRNRRSGLLLTALLAVLILTGYLLYYFVSEVTRPWVSFAHWGLGLAMPLLLLAHLGSVQRERADRTRAGR